MNFEQLTISIEPRTPWQALDLGVQVAKHWYVSLLWLWLSFALPINAALILLLGLDSIYTYILIWWFKPLYEQPLLYYISRAVFSEPITVTDTLKAMPRYLRSHLWTYLTWARLSSSRILGSAVTVLEGLTGSRQRQRLSALKSRKNHLLSLMVVCIHVEFFLFAALIIFLFSIIPTELYKPTWDYAATLIANQAWPYWYELFTTITTVLFMMLIAPFFVCCSFTAYLNTRVNLEAWDIEQAFRTTARRLQAQTAIPAST